MRASVARHPQLMQSTTDEGKARAGNVRCVGARVRAQFRQWGKRLIVGMCVNSAGSAGLDVVVHDVPFGRFALSTCGPAIASPPVAECQGHPNPATGDYDQTNADSLRRLYRVERRNQSSAHIVASCIAYVVVISLAIGASWISIPRATWAPTIADRPGCLFIP